MDKTAKISVVVSSLNTAATMGSGALEVFATPAMIALMEGAAVAAVKEDVTEGNTTVGTQMNVSHLKSSKIGETITATATLTATEGRKMVFSVEAHNDKGELIGKGTHERFIVNIERFMR